MLQPIYICVEFMVNVSALPQFNIATAILHPNPNRKESSSNHHFAAATLHFTGVNIPFPFGASGFDNIPAPEIVGWFR